MRRVLIHFVSGHTAVLATALGVFCLNMVFSRVALAISVMANTLGLTSLTLLDFIEAVLVAMGPRSTRLCRSRRWPSVLPSG